MLDHILIPLDDPSFEVGAFSHALTIAQAVHGQITLLRLLGQATTPQFVDPLAWQISKAEAEAHLDKIASELQDTGVAVNKALLESSDVGQLIAFAQQHEINLIVMAQSGGSWSG